MLFNTKFSRKRNLHAFRKLHEFIIYLNSRELSLPVSATKVVDLLQ